jgi:hypothetical protein
LKHTTNTLNRLEHWRILNSLEHVLRLILVLQEIAFRSEFPWSFSRIIHITRPKKMGCRKSRPL